MHHSRCYIHVHSVHACRFIMIHTSTRDAVLYLYLQFGFSCAVPVPLDSFLSPRANNGGWRPSILPLVSIINYVVQSTYAQHDRLATCCCRVFSSKRILKGSVSYIDKDTEFEIFLLVIENLLSKQFSDEETSRYRFIEGQQFCVKS